MFDSISRGLGGITVESCNTKSNKAATKNSYPNYFFEGNWEIIYP